MSSVTEHFDSIADDAEDIKRECKVMQDDGHFSDDLVLKGASHILQIVDGIKKHIQKTKESE